MRTADVDLVTGRGLDEALDGVRAVYHLAPNVHPDEVGIARRVVASAGLAMFAALDVAGLAGNPRVLTMLSAGRPPVARRPRARMVSQTGPVSEQRVLSRRSTMPGWTTG